MWYILCNGEKYGYIRQFKKRNGGIIRPHITAKKAICTDTRFHNNFLNKAGSYIKFRKLYPTLYRLVEKGLITDLSEKVGKRRVRVYYHLETAGEKYLKELKREYISHTAGDLKILGVKESRGLLMTSTDKLEAKKNCPYALRKHLDAELKTSLIDFCESQGNLTMEKIEKRFGNPKQYAAEYFSLGEASDIDKKLNHSKRLKLRF